MVELGMLIDVSHLGDAGILEILDMVDPHTHVIASHSNARAGIDAIGLGTDFDGIDDTLEIRDPGRMI